MVGDVALGPAPRVGAQPVARPLDRAQHAHAGKAVADLVVVQHRHVHQRLQVGRVPPAVQVCFREPEVAFANDAGEQPRVLHVEMPGGAGPAALDCKSAPVRQAERQAADLEPAQQREHGLGPPRQAFLPRHGLQGHAAVSLAVASCPKVNARRTKISSENCGLDCRAHRRRVKRRPPPENADLRRAAEGTSSPQPWAAESLGAPDLAQRVGLGSARITAPPARPAQSPL